eukprot:c21458_g1_i1 orf=183-1298(+)
MPPLMGGEMESLLITSVILEVEHVQNGQAHDCARPPHHHELSFSAMAHPPLENRSVLLDLPGVTVYNDLAITRHPLPLPDSPVSPHSHFVNGVACKDVAVNTDTGVWVRIFLPELDCVDAVAKLPIVVYFFGGGFICGGADTPETHDICENLTKKCKVLVVAVNYRRAPEHRLPAAFDDGFHVLNWLQMQAKLASAQAGGLLDAWLSSHANFSICFLMGYSSGGNIVHQLALRAAREDIYPLKLQGLIMIVPYFGRTSRTSSEIEYGGGEHFNLQISDTCWALALPQGVDRDHPFCNPLNPEAPKLEGVGIPRCLVIIGGKDILHDIQVEYAFSLMRSKVDVQLVDFKEAGHIMPDYLEEHRRLIFDFIHR